METRSRESEDSLEVLGEIIDELSGFLKDSWLSRLTDIRGKMQESYVKFASEIERQKEEGEALKVQIQVLSSEIERQKAEVEALWRDEIEPRKVQVQVLTSEIERQKEESKAEIGRYQKVLESMCPVSKLLAENLQLDKSTAESNLKLMQEKLDHLKPELDRRQSLAEGITKRIEHIDVQTKNIESEIENLKEGGDFWLEEIEVLQGQKTALASIVEKFWESLGKAEVNISRIKKKMEEAREDNDRWQAHIDELAERIKGAEALFREIAAFSEPSSKSADQEALARDVPVTVH